MSKSKSDIFIDKANFQEELDTIREKVSSQLFSTQPNITLLNSLNKRIFQIEAIIDYIDQLLL